MFLLECLRSVFCDGKLPTKSRPAGMWYAGLAFDLVHRYQQDPKSFLGYKDVDELAISLGSTPTTMRSHMGQSCIVFEPRFNNPLWAKPLTSEEFGYLFLVLAEAFQLDTSQFRAAIRQLDMDVCAYLKVTKYPRVPKRPVQPLPTPQPAVVPTQKPVRMPIPMRNPILPTPRLPTPRPRVNVRMPPPVRCIGPPSRLTSYNSRMSTPEIGQVASTSYVPPVPVQPIVVQPTHPIDADVIVYPAPTVPPPVQVVPTCVEPENVVIPRQVYFEASYDNSINNEEVEVISGGLGCPDYTCSESVRQDPDEIIDAATLVPSDSELPEVIEPYQPGPQYDTTQFHEDFRATIESDYNSSGISLANAYHAGDTTSSPGD